MKKNIVKPDADSELRRRAEELLKKKAEARPPLKEEDRLKLIHELQVHQIELELQNEELRKARDEVEAGMQRYSDLYEFAPVGYFTLSKDRTVLSANLTGSQILGLERSHLIKRHLGQFIAEESRPAFMAFIKKVYEGKTKESCELTLLKENKQPFFAHIEAMISGDEQECRAAVIDITEHKKLEALQARDTSIIEFSEDAIIGIMPDGLITSWNPGAEKIFGYSSQEAVGQSIDILIPLERMAEETPIPLRHGEIIEHFETVRVRKDGALIDVSMTISPIRDKAGEIIGASMIAHDITGRKKTELELQISEARYRRLFETAQDGIFIVDANTEQIIDVNPFLTNMLGYPAMEFLGNKVSEINVFNDCPTLRDGFLELFKEGHVSLEHLRLKTKDGNKLDVEFIGRGYFDATDKFIQCNLRDITLRKQAQEALAKVYSELEQRVQERTLDLSRANDQLLHEINERKQANEALQTAFSEIKSLKEQLKKENIYLREELNLLHAHKDIIGNSDAIRAVLEQVEQVAGTDSTVLVQGDTGTGKELIAVAIHNLSSRKDRTMVKVNCAALPPTLIESELFGREKGAFTGALSKQMGRFELADNSTIFLDEIDALPLELQAKLLRVLESGEFERLGSPRTIKVNVRIISATNRDLAAAVSAGGFREDLYYRLNIFQIKVPPLRERREDIMPLVWFFVKGFSERMGKRIESIPQKSVQSLQAYSWPGNIRELRNVIERAMIINSGPVLNLNVPELSQPCAKHGRTLEEVEREHIIEALEVADWKVSGKNGAAEILGLNPKTLESKVKKLGILKSRNTS